MAIAPHRYRVEGDVNGGILNGLVRYASAALSAHLHHEFALEFRRKVTTYHELRIVALEDFAGNSGAIWKKRTIVPIRIMLAEAADLLNTAAVLIV